MQDLLDKAFRTFNIFIPVIAVTVFLISAIVILSIMQITIKGRTREIGLRKALGARPRDLQTQIVLEVLSISVVSSVIGLMLAQIGSMAVAPMLAAKFGVKHVSPPTLAMATAVGAAVAAGLLGGMLPARRAARLNPVEALR
jgi:putative ABC transport system permease protein